MGYKSEEAVHQTCTSTPDQEKNDELPLNENLGEGQGGEERKEKRGEGREKEGKGERREGRVREEGKVERGEGKGERGEGKGEGKREKRGRGVHKCTHTHTHTQVHT